MLDFKFTFKSSFDLNQNVNFISLIIQFYTDTVHFCTMLLLEKNDIINVSIKILILLLILMMLLLGIKAMTLLGIKDIIWNKTLLLRRKAMTNLDSILKSKDITLPTKIHLVKAMIFPVVMYGCESWTIKKAKCRKIDAFVLWYWRRLLRVPWTARRFHQSILKEISPEYSLEDWCWSWNSNI